MDDSYLGKVFGRLKVIDMDYTNPKYDQFICECACGNKKIINKYSVLSGKTKSCGCYRKNTPKLVHVIASLKELHVRIHILEKMNRQCINLVYVAALFFFFLCMLIVLLPYWWQ